MEEEKTLHHVYTQCMRNQSPNLGTHTVDGCGEFLPDNSHTGLHCSACGCHRSFHRKISAPSTATESHEEKEGHRSTRRARTKFTEEQKEKMGRFAEGVGWRVPKRGRDQGEEMEVERFLEEAGVSRRAFKVWMHNHRNNNNVISCVAGRGRQGSVAAADSSGTDGTETDDVSVLAITASGYSY